MKQTSTLQSAIESVEALSVEDQDLRFDLLQKRRIAQRRQEIAQNGLAAMAAVKNGTAQRGNAAEIMADIFGDEECAP